jgi:hypothetical protein
LLVSHAGQGSAYPHMHERDAHVPTSSFLMWVLPQAYVATQMAEFEWPPFSDSQLYVCGTQPTCADWAAITVAYCASPSYNLLNIQVCRVDGGGPAVRGPGRAIKLTVIVRFVNTCPAFT